MIHRGEIWWADLPEPRGSGPGHRRPLVVVQSNEFNESGISTIVGVIVTTNTRLAAAPGNVLLSRRVSRLPKESVVNVSQVVTVDRSELLERISTLPGDVLDRINEGLRIVLAL